jgi:hypothetical protein
LCSVDPRQIHSFRNNGARIMFCHRTEVDTINITKTQSSGTPTILHVPPHSGH